MVFWSRHSFCFLILAFWIGLLFWLAIRCCDGVFVVFSCSFVQINYYQNPAKIFQTASACGLYAHGSLWQIFCDSIIKLLIHIKNPPMPWYMLLPFNKVIFNYCVVILKEDNIPVMATSYPLLLSLLLLFIDQPI